MPDHESARELVQLLRDAADSVALRPPVDREADSITIALRTYLGDLAQLEDGEIGGRETSYSRQARQLAIAHEASQDHEPMPVIHPLLAGLTPVFPDLEFVVAEGHVECVAVFGPAFEGPPGLVHGGFVSAGFDVVVSLAAAQLLPWSMTRRLKIRFLRPTYLDDRLSFTADAEQGDGRSILVKAKLKDGRGKTTASAAAEFVTFEPERFADRQGYRSPLG